MFCIECGKEIPDGVKFCPHCGERTSTKSETTRAPTELKNKRYQCSDCNFYLDANMHRCPRCKGEIIENERHVPSQRFRRPYARKDYSSDNQSQVHSNQSFIGVYILSFLIPLAGIIIGAIYLTNNDKVIREAGGNCIAISLVTIILTFWIALITFQ